MKEFIRKHGSEIVGVLNGFDRIRFRGTIRTLAVTGGLMAWLGLSTATVSVAGAAPMEAAAARTRAARTTELLK